MVPISPANAPANTTPTANGQGNSKIADAARQFESLLIAQMLKSMHDSEGGWLGTGSDESASSGMEYAQEMFAQSLSANGGLGLAQMVAEGLASGDRR